MQQIIIKRLSCFGRGCFGLAIVWSILWGAGVWGQGWRWGFITFSVWIKGNARLLFCFFFSSMNLSSFSIGFDGNMQHIPQPSRQSCKNLSTSEETLIPSLLLPGEMLKTLPFLPWATLQNTFKKKKKKCCNYFYEWPSFVGCFSLVENIPQFALTSICDHIVWFLFIEEAH